MKLFEHNWNFGGLDEIKVQDHPYFSKTEYLNIRPPFSDPPQQSFFFFV